MPIKQRRDIAVMIALTQRAHVFRLAEHGEKPTSDDDFVDSIEEYIFKLPRSPIGYTDMVTKWVLPYVTFNFNMFGVPLKLTPLYAHRSDNRVEIRGLLVQLNEGTVKVMTKVTGPRGTWHSKIKFFAKANTQSTD